MPPSLFRLAKSPVQIGLIFRLSEKNLVKTNMAKGLRSIGFNYMIRLEIRHGGVTTDSDVKCVR